MSNNQSGAIKIAISGRSGCGNTSVSRIVAQTLGLRLINYTFHNMAEERGISFEELCRRAEEDKQYDLFLDKKQTELAADGNCVLGSRLAIWFLKDADLKVYLEASPKVRAKRISGREVISLEQSLDNTEARDNRDRARYLKLYNIDIENYQFADLIIDTELGDQNYVANLILNRARTIIQKKSS